MIKCNEVDEKKKDKSLTIFMVLIGLVVYLSSLLYERTPTKMKIISFSIHSQRGSSLLDYFIEMYDVDRRFFEKIKKLRTVS